MTAATVFIPFENLSIAIIVGINIFHLHFCLAQFLLSETMVVNLPLVCALTILTGKNLFSVQKFMEMQGWLLLTFSMSLHYQLSYFNFIIVQMSEKRDSSNRQ